MRRFAPDRRCHPTFHLLGLSILTMLGLGSSLSAEEPPQVLASYRNTVDAAELDGWLLFRGEQASADREVELRELIMIRSLAEAAVGLGLDRRPEVRLELELEDAALATAALQRHLRESVRVSDEETEAKYQEIKDTYTRPRRVRLRNLFKRYPVDATDADKEAVLAEMQRLRQRLLDGEDFGELAAQESDSQSRFQKGLLGNVPAGTFPPRIDEVAMAMQPGEISDILHGADGLTLLYCEKILEKVVRTPEDLRQIARGLLEKQAYKTAWAELEAALLAAADPRYRWQALDADPRDPDATVVELAGDRLSVADVERLLRSGRTPTEPSRVPREQLRQRLDKYLIARMMPREADRRGLAERDGLGTRRLWARRHVLASHARIHLVESEFKVPAEEEILQYYQAHRADFVRHAVYDVAAIQLPLGQADDRASYRQGELIVHRIRTGETSFEEAARDHSHHPSAAGGGRLGPISRRVLPHRFGFNVLRALLRMQVGEVSDLVADEGENLWILRLDGIEPKRLMTYDEARTLAENRLATERARAVEARILDQWMAKLQVETAR